MTLKTGVMTADNLALPSQELITSKKKKYIYIYMYVCVCNIIIIIIIISIIS